MTKSKKYRLRFLFQEIDLTPGEFLIGRSPACNLTLEDPLVSRTHARLLVEEDSVTIGDLGSRNGTLVNGEPVFDSHLLSDKERIRIGTHDMIFLEEPRHPAKALRPTGTLTVCTMCKTPFPASGSRCPHCSTAAVPDISCPRCRLAVAPNDEYCSRCGTVIDRDDPTIPIDIGGGSTGWTSRLMNEVIEKAISAKSFSHAAKLLEGKIENFELKENQGTSDISLLLDIGSHNALLARELRESDRLDWIVDKWAKIKTPMPLETFDGLLASSAGWYDMLPKLEEYLKILESTEGKSDDVVKLILRIEGLVRGDRS